MFVHVKHTKLTCCGEGTSAPYLESVWPFPTLSLMCTRKVNPPTKPWPAHVHTRKHILIASQTSSVKKDDLACLSHWKSGGGRRAAAGEQERSLHLRVQCLGGECVRLVKVPSSLHVMPSGVLGESPDCVLCIQIEWNDPAVGNKAVAFAAVTESGHQHPHTHLTGLGPLSDWTGSVG